MEPSGPTPFLMPPRTHDAHGHERRVGIEIEFAGLPVDEAVALVVQVFGGRIERKNRFNIAVEDTIHGDFHVEVDARLLKERRYIEFLRTMGADDRTIERIEDGLEWMASAIVPCEIVTPPIPLSSLDGLERLRKEMRAANAEGTNAGFFYAFGLHINAEVPDLQTETLLAHLRAFLVLEDWLGSSGETDPIRRLTPYIRPFPASYRRKLLEPSYRPDLDTLIDDYLADNPTRNRPLDMLTVFAVHRRQKIEQGMQEPELLKPRPAFHYRLPNCRIDEPQWSFAQEWNRWVEVERLAADPERLDELALLQLEHA